MRERFARAYGGVPATIWSAPGRVNLIGEHVDYAGGDVLPIAISARTYVAAGPISGAHAYAVAGRRRPRGAFDPAHPTRSGSWWDYLAGVSRALGSRGVAVPPLAIAVAGDVPSGAGLSSSAALCVAAAGALGRAAGAELTNTDLASVAHQAETEFVGVPCGIMDQHASARCEKGFALHLRCSDAHAELVPFRGEVLIFDTAEPRALRHSRYDERRREADLSLAELRRLDPTIPSLSEAPIELIERAQLAPALRARARHIATETRRVRDAVRAMAQRGHFPGALFTESHASLRDDYECSTDALNWFVDAAIACAGIEGARLTGAGWGGCAIATGEHQALMANAPILAEQFAKRFQRMPRWWMTGAEAGAKEEVEGRA